MWPKSAYDFLASLLLFRNRRFAEGILIPRKPIPCSIESGNVALHWGRTFLRKLHKNFMSHLNFVTISRIGASCESISISTHCPTDLCAVSLGKHSDSCRHNTTHILSIENAGTGKTWKLQQRKLEQQTASFVKPRAGELELGTAGVWSLELERGQMCHFTISSTPGQLQLPS